MPVKKCTLSFEESRQFSSLFMDYMNGKKELRPFYSYEPAIGSFQKAIDHRKILPLDRQLLSGVILDQYGSGIKEALNDFQRVKTNIELLSDPDTFTVCTGHQPCILTGPLYFIFKIITTINLAERLKKEYPAYSFVPVYWIGSEDHDFDEISSVHMFGREFSWRSEAGGAVGRMNTASMKLLLDELSQVLGGSGNAKELLELFSKAYLSHPTLADATRYLVHELFSAYGLVVIDGDDARLKSLFMPFMQDDLQNHTNYKLVTASIARLKEAGYEAQVNPREINLFRLSDNDRIRIEKADDGIMKLAPQELSTNVVLRPLYQQTILPNLAYVGGPGEIAYWLEYKAMFDHHKVLFPVLMPRNFAVLSDEKAGQQMEKFGLKARDLFQDVDMLLKEFVSKHAENDISLKKQETEMKNMFDQLAAKASAVDPTLKASVEGEFQKALASLKNIESKLMRSEKQKQETSLNQIKKLRDKWLPGGVLQERHDNFAPYYLKSGRHLIPFLKEAFDPFEFKLLILEL